MGPLEDSDSEPINTESSVEGLLDATEDLPFVSLTFLLGAVLFGFRSLCLAVEVSLIVCSGLYGASDDRSCLWVAEV